MKYSNKFFSLFIILLFFNSVETRTQQKPFDFQGIYLEGCNCQMVCSCDLYGEMVKGCQVMGAMIISSGSYADFKISNMKIAFAIGDKWVRIYLQSEDPEQDKVAAEMAEMIFSSYGIVESVSNAEIELSGSNGNYTLTVDQGKVIELKTQSVLGADGKTAVTYTNYPDPLFHTIMQAKVVSGSYNDGDRHFKLEGSNSFFNNDWAVSTIK